MESPIALAGLLVGTSALTSFGVLCLMAVWLKPKVVPGIAPGQYSADQAVFVFDDTRLVDCNDAATQIMAAQDSIRDTAVETPFAALARKISAYFPDFERQAASLAQVGEISMASVGDTGMSLRAVWRRGLAHIILEDTRAEGGKTSLDRLTFHAMRDELSGLRALTEDAPIPMWRESATGDIIWGNKAYLDLARQVHDDAVDSVAWPLPAVFAHQPRGVIAGSATPSAATLTVTDTVFDGEQTLSFDIALTTHDGGRSGYALPAQAKSNSALRRDLVHTLAKAFTTLPVGLAVFDEKRRLQVFNPALTDLTGLPTDFLLSRPGFDRFLYQMREKRLLPEAADFTTWRAQLLAVERATDSGQYEEEWTLADGRTFHVTGHPQPGGAIALFIDDVSSDMALTRALRTAVDTGQAVLDALSDPIIVFSSKGHAVIDNSAYRALWQTDASATLGTCTAAQALAQWRAVFGAQTPALDRVEAALRARIEVPQRHPLSAPDGTDLMIQTHNLGSGQMLVRFTTPHYHPARDVHPIADVSARQRPRAAPLIPSAVAAAARAPAARLPVRTVKVRHSSNRADTPA